MAAEAKKLVMDPDLPLGPALEAALAGVVSYATRWAARAEEAPERAVHAYRKSLRRARAVIKLTRDLLGAEGYAELNDAIRNATRPTSDLRDADVLVGLAQSALRKKRTREALDALEQRLALRREALNRPEHVARILAEGAAQVSDLPQRFGALLPATVSRQDLQRALRRSYQRARKAFRRARETERDEEVHAWRKRVKEVRYQLEMLTELTGETPEHRTLADLAESLGRVTDGIVLREATLAEREALSAAGVAKLVTWLEASLADLLSPLFVQGEEFFAPAPKAFVARVLQGVKNSGRVRREG